MDWEEMELELVAVAERLGAEVRHVRYEGEGGLCTLRGRKVLVVNDVLEAPERVAVIARGVAGLPGVEDVFVVPEIRRLLDKYAAEGSD